VVEDCVRLLQGCSEEDLMKTEEIVSRNPRVMHGELVFAGTRVPVQTLVDYFKAGDTLDVFLEDFPTVDREQAVAYLEMTLKATDLARAAG
jgi:uncharacterized protein (DUF433 family)